MRDGEKAMKTSGLTAGALLVALLMTAIASGGSCAEDEYESGDSWAYDLDMTIESLLLSGTTTSTYDGESSKSVAGYAYSTYEMRYHGSMTVTGSIEGYAVTGTATLNEVDSIDQESMNLVVSDYTMSMTMSVVILGTAYGMDYSEHNVSTYSPPGGVGDEPKDPDEGTSWTKTYNVHYETTVNDDGDITTESSSISLTGTYTYLGIRTITVPAGTFECEVIQTDYGDGISTDWYCDDVGTYVKSVYESGSTQSGTEHLTSFSYTPPSSGGALSNAMMFMIAGIVVVAVVVVVVAWILVRRKSPPDGQQIGPVTQGPGSPKPPAG
jgi:hypothetical protein